MFVKNEETVLKIVVGDEHSLVVGIQRQPRLKRQQSESNDESDGAERQYGNRVLLPILLTGVQFLVEPAQRPGGWKLLSMTLAM